MIAKKFFRLVWMVVTLCSSHPGITSDNELFEEAQEKIKNMNPGKEKDIISDILKDALLQTHMDRGAFISLMKNLGVILKEPSPSQKTSKTLAFAPLCLQGVKSKPVMRKGGKDTVPSENTPVVILNDARERDKSPVPHLQASAWLCGLAKDCTRGIKSELLQMVQLRCANLLKSFSRECESTSCLKIQALDVHKQRPENLDAQEFREQTGLLIGQYALKDKRLWDALVGCDLELAVKEAVRCFRDKKMNPQRYQADVQEISLAIRRTIFLDDIIEGSL